MRLQFWSEVEVPVRIPLMGQIDLFKKLFALDRNSSYDITLNYLY